MLHTYVRCEVQTKSIEMWFLHSALCVGTLEDILLYLLYGGDTFLVFVCPGGWGAVSVISVYESTSCYLFKSATLIREKNL